MRFDRIAELRPLLLPASYDPQPGGNDIVPLIPAYMRLQTHNARLPRRLAQNVPAHRDPRFATAVFAPSAVHTVDPASFRPSLTDAEWSYVEVLCSVDAFRDRVLSPVTPGSTPGAPAAPVPSFTTHLTKHHVDDLRDKNYIQRVHSLLFACVVFCLFKADGFLRLLWNGIEFNKLCRDPPYLDILAYHIMLSLLLHQSVTCYVAFDFKTWFLQLMVHPEVARYFGTRLSHGALYILKGVPMGWSWACAIAHAITVAFAREVVRELGIPETSMFAAFCIDNSIIAIRDGSVDANALLAAVDTVARRHGVVIKQSATERGRAVDWLPYHLDLDTRAATFKASYRQKLALFVQRAHALARPDTTLRVVWQAAGLVLYSIYAAGWPYTRVRNTMEWLSSNAPPPDQQQRWNAPAPFPHHEELARVAAQLIEARIQPLQLPVLDTAPAWFVTDAAGPSATHASYAAFILVTPLFTRLTIRPSSEEIDEAELRIQADAMSAALEVVPDDSTVVGWSDSRVALAAVRRGYALWAPTELSDRIEANRAAALRRRIALWSPHVDTLSCLADPWTRGQSSVTLSFELPACGPTHTYGLGRLCACAVSRLMTADPSARFAGVHQRWTARTPEVQPSYQSWYHPGSS
jgi:hypothetical protein